MTTETIRTIVDGLNSAPFERGYSLVSFDSMPPDKLLQTLSDVLCWIEGMPDIDIRSEAPDETTMRLIQALRVLKYPPPRDMDHIQKWRLDIVEGGKGSIYPILEWVFSNVDRLKERIYLARYLTRTEVPPEEMTPEIQRVQNILTDRMEEFKHIHHRIVESRTDFSRAEDVRADLKAMEEEKEQLQRKIDKVKRIAANRGDISRFLDMASKLRMETEKNDELNVERQTQRNALLHAEQRVQRLNRMRSELEKEKDSINPQRIIDKLKREIETNSYIVNEKLKREIETQRKNVANVNKILNMKTVTNSDIINLKKRIDALNKDIIDITNERDKKDEDHEDKLSIYRHQSMNIQRKKQNVADHMQTVKTELDQMERVLAEKKRDLAARTGSDDIITTVQFKKYIAELRNKTTIYKRRKVEMEDFENEAKILHRTVEILEQDWQELKQSIESAGRGVIESISNQQARPKTAKPTATDIDDLREMTKELNDRVLTRRKSVQQLQQEIEQFQNDHKEINQEYESKRAKFNEVKNSMESDLKQLEDTVARLDNQLKKHAADKAKIAAELADKGWIKDEVENNPHVVIEMNQRNSQVIKDIESLRSKLNELTSKGGAGDQLLMWKGIVKVLEKKIQYFTKTGPPESPIGDRFG